ncbi:MAG: hypothetical protein IKN55_04990 [Oscillospiraceae bacterium]|nr:hypothetical protein [Oscillospiraceae bacterium]
MKSAKQIISTITAAGMSAVCLAGAFTGYADTPPSLGDVNGNTIVNASDAAQILIAAAKIGAGGESGLTAEQMSVADVNHDSVVNASDAAIVLVFAAYIGAGGSGTLEAYLENTLKPEPGTYNAGTWKTAAVEGSPGEIVTIPITAENLADGMNAYLVTFDLPHDFVITDFEGNLPNFDIIGNLETGTFAATNFSGENMRPKIDDNVPIFYIDVKIPEDAHSDDRYPLRFSNVTVCSIDMETAEPQLTEGVIIVR